MLYVCSEPQSEHSHGTLSGIPIYGEDGEGPAYKTWNFMLALGNVVCAWLKVSVRSTPVCSCF